MVKPKDTTKTKKPQIKALVTSVHYYRATDSDPQVEFQVKRGQSLDHLPEPLVSSLVRSGMAVEVVDFDPGTDSTL